LSLIDSEFLIVSKINLKQYQIAQAWKTYEAKMTENVAPGRSHRIFRKPAW
jgi:hypothetical protein